MNPIHRFFLVALAMAGSVTGMAAPSIKTINNAIETQAGSIVLPSGPGSTLVITCSGCQPTSYLATAQTRYLANDKPIALVEFKSLLTAHPTMPVTVTYSVKSHELIRVQVYVEVAHSGRR